MVNDSQNNGNILQRIASIEKEVHLLNMDFLKSYPF